MFLIIESIKEFTKFCDLEAQADCNINGQDSIIPWVGLLQIQKMT